jgi:hypothetical protein
MKPHYKEYNFTDWINQDLRDIQNHYWTPFEPEVGKNTQLDFGCIH